MRTKIVATVGPATDSQEKIDALVEAGVNVIRLNFAHGKHDDKRRLAGYVRAAASRHGRPVGILADLAGPKIRIGELPVPIDLVKGSAVTLAPETLDPSFDEIPHTYEPLARDISAGAQILLDDGYLELVVDSVQPDTGRVKATVVRGGPLRPRKGMNLPASTLSVPSLTEKDIEDLEVALELDVEFVGLSFVRRAVDVADLIRRMPAEGRPLVVAKIEKGAALDDLDRILDVTDCVMVARGDLGVELPYEEVPFAQKRIIQEANFHSRPVITATQMLESMIKHGRPTRAEVSDVWNSVGDATSAVMLSAETAAGSFPVEAVRAMASIVRSAEERNVFDDGPHYDVPARSALHVGATATEHAIAIATIEAARRVGAAAIVCLTNSGFTARLVSGYRPSCPIIGVSHVERTVRQMTLVWGTEPVYAPNGPAYGEMVAAATRHLLENGLARLGDRIVVTASANSAGVSGSTNMVRIETLG